MAFTLVSVDLFNGGSLSLKSLGPDVSQNIGVILQEKKLVKVMYCQIRVAKCEAFVDFMERQRADSKDKFATLGCPSGEDNHRQQLQQ